MKIRLLSDLHFDHYSSKAKISVEDYLAAEPDRDVDVLILAGDLGTSAQVLIYVRKMKAAYPDSEVIFVPGNHDFWGTTTTLNSSIGLMMQVCAQSGVHMLHDREIRLKARKGDEWLSFFGTTLWFPKTPEAESQRHGWIDFQAIRGSSSWIYEQNAAAKLAIRKTKADVVITHHIPDPRLVAPEWRGNRSNCYFVGDDQKNTATRPKLWCFGHTHTVSDQVIDGVRYVCNPRGYPGEGTNGKADHVIELQGSP